MTDQQFCIDILPRVSRTFALSIEALPDPLRKAVRTSYLLCRIVDTIEDDDSLARDVQAALFDDFLGLMTDDVAPATALEAGFTGRKGPADFELCAKAGAVFRSFRALPPPLADAARPHIIEMAEGMKEYSLRWQGRESLTVLEDVPDLERYCYFVAGTVGNLLTSSFLEVEKGLGAATREGLSSRAVSFGLGLQMTNIVKDVTADRERGWCYLPATLCEKHGVAPQDLLDPRRATAAMAVVGDVVSLAEEHLASALEYTILLPVEARDVRLFVLVPLVLALATVNLVRRSPDVLVAGKPVKVSRTTVAKTLLRARAVVGDDAGIRQLCARAARLEL